MLAQFPALHVGELCIGYGEELLHLVAQIASLRAARIE